VHYERHERFAGVTKYPLSKMVGFAFDGIASFSTLPLRVATWLGAIAGLLAMGLGAWAFYVKLRTAGAVPGWTTIMILVALGSSVQLVVIGILGAYVGRIYEEVQRRPLYTVAREVNLATRDQGGPSDDVRVQANQPPSRAASTGQTRGGKAP
jgi:dolichol-phosphate mannosyltransferase